MMEDHVDLHIHSNKSSDGDVSPYDIVQLAKEEGLRAISISDHDTVSAYPEALYYGKEAGVEIIPNIELTTLYEKREFHLLLPFVDTSNDILNEIVNKVAEGRLDEARQRVQKLKELEFDITWEEVIEQSGGQPPLGVKIAQILLKKQEKSGNFRIKKYFDSKNRDFAPYFFYKDYFMEAKPAYVPKRNINLLDILEIAPKMGGVPVLAHPGSYFMQVKEKDLIILKEKGLQGLEVYTSYHDISQTETYKSMAEKLDLVPTAGSDFHGAIKPHIPFGFIKDGRYWMVDELRKRKS